MLPNSGKRVQGKIDILWVGIRTDHIMSYYTQVSYHILLYSGIISYPSISDAAEQVAPAIAISLTDHQTRTKGETDARPRLCSAGLSLATNVWCFDSAFILASASARQAGQGRAVQCAGRKPGDKRRACTSTWVWVWVWEVWVWVWVCVGAGGLRVDDGLNPS